MEGLQRADEFSVVRKGEHLRSWTRSKRVFLRNNQWYFNTREALDVGPYRTRFEAEVEADLLKCSLQKAAPDEAPEVIRQFMLDSVEQNVFAVGGHSQDVMMSTNHADIAVLSSAG